MKIYQTEHDACVREGTGLSLFTWSLFLVCLALACVAVYARLYGLPGEYHADNLIAEDMYRDLIEQGGAWSQWGLSGAAMYLELGMYFVVRWIAGDVHSTMAAYGALMCLLLLLSALYMVWPLLRTRESKKIILCSVCVLIVIQVCGDNPVFAYAKLAHALTVSFAILSCGILLRIVEDNSKILLFPLAFLVCSMTASDALYVMYFVIPSCFFILFLWWSEIISFRHFCLIAILLAGCVVLGKYTDAALRTFPTHFNPFDFGFIRSLETLWALLCRTANVLVSSFGVLLAGGWLGLVLALRQGGVVCRWSGFCILVAVLNVGAIAATGNDRPIYLGMWFAIPCTVGVLLCAAHVFSLVHRQRIVATLVSLCVLAGLGWTAQAEVAAMRPAFIPPLVTALDQLAREKGLRTGLADYWDARPVNVLSREGVRLMPLEWYGYRYLMANNTRSLLRERVDMLVLNPKSSPYFSVNRELEIRANGEPDEIIDLPEGLQALIYHKGAHHPTEAELMLDGARLMPERAAGDRVQWKGELRLAPGLTLTEVRSAPRDSRHVALLFFKEPVAQIQGVTLRIAAVGDKLTRHRRTLAQYISPQADSVLDSLLLWLFVPDRVWTLNQDNSAPLPDGGSFTWGKLPNWNSKEWAAIFLDDGSKVHRIK